MSKKVLFILSLAALSIIVACQNPVSDTPAPKKDTAVVTPPADNPPAYSYLYLQN